MNLLPITEKEILKKGLKTRFVIVTMILTSLAFLISIIMLIPSYFLIKEHSSTVLANNALMKTGNEESLKDILNLPKEIDTKLKYFQSNLSSTGVISSFGAITSRLPEKVKLDSISFTRNQTYKGKKGISILISGMAADRESLVYFGNQLKESGLFNFVDMPVSSLTKEKDLPFSMNIFIIEDQK